MEKVEKERTTLYLEKHLKKLAETQTNNLSELVNSILRKYLSVTSEDQIIREIQKHKDTIAILEGKLAKLKTLGKDKDELIESESFKQLKEFYKKRREQGIPEELDDMWITSATNLERCRLLGKNPSEILEELRQWYINE